MDEDDQDELGDEVDEDADIQPVQGVCSQLADFAVLDRDQTFTQMRSNVLDREETFTQMKSKMSLTARRRNMKIDKTQELRQDAFSIMRQNKSTKIRRENSKNNSAN